MKKFYFSIITVAFFATAFTGCSSDNEAVQSTDGLKNTGLTLYVTTDNLAEETGTRSFMSRDLKTHMYTSADEMRVYDNDLHRYDIYKFSWNDETKSRGVFRRSNPSSNITAAKWALYPKSGVASGHWDLNEETGVSTTVAWIRIASNAAGNLEPIIYDGTYQASDAQHSNPLYMDILPRWGQVTETSDGLETNLSYLTGALKLQLAGTPEKADHIKVQMLENGTDPLNIAGTFQATLAINNERQADADLAVDTYMENTGGTEIIVDLSQASADLQGTDRTKAVVFVPLVTTPDKTVDIVCYASKDGGSTYTEFKRFTNKTIARGKVYGNSVVYDFTE